MSEAAHLMPCSKALTQLPVSCRTLLLLLQATGSCLETKLAYLRPESRPRYCFKEITSLVSFLGSPRKAKKDRTASNGKLGELRPWNKAIDVELSTLVLRSSRKHDIIFCVAVSSLRQRCCTLVVNYFRYTSGPVRDLTRAVNKRSSLKLHTFILMQFT